MTLSFSYLRQAGVIPNGPALMLNKKNDGTTKGTKDYIQYVLYSFVTFVVQNKFPM
jgi:hypothetical protein